MCSKTNLVFWVPRVPVTHQKVKWAFQGWELEANCKYLYTDRMFQKSVPGQT